MDNRKKFTPGDPKSVPAGGADQTPKDGRPAAALREKPIIDAITGSLSLSIPINTSPGRSGFGPSLLLSYDSSAGNSPFGLGWNLSSGNVSRKTSKMVPQYRDDSDVFVLSGFDDLVPIPVSHNQDKPVDGYLIQRYQPRVVSEVFRIERCTNANDAGDVFWRTISGDNVVNVFGRSDQSRVFAVEETIGQRRIFSWLIDEAYDGHGNHMVYSYKAEDTAGVPTITDPAEQNRSKPVKRYLKSIKYGNLAPNRDLDTWKVVDDNASPRQNDWLFEVVLDFGEHDETSPTTAEVKEWSCRKQPFSTFTSGFEIRTYRLCNRFLMFHHMPNELGGSVDTLVSSTVLEYDEGNGVGGAPLLKRCTQWGHDSGASQSLPPVEFGYSVAPGLASLQPTQADTTSMLYVPTGISNQNTQWVDLDGEGTPGLLTQHDGAWFYQRNESARDGGAAFGPAKVLPENPNIPRHGYYLDSLGATEKLDLICVNPHTGLATGYYERMEGDGWTNFVPFKSLPEINISDPRVRRVDLTGNGTADILYFMDDGSVTWYPSLGQGGFGDKQQPFLGYDTAPRLVLDDEKSAVYVADMSGDGLADLVEIRNGRIAYWPNMGYGRFAKQILMDNSPQMDRSEQFNHLRIRLAAIAGSGTTDVVYLKPGGGALVFYNLAGNTWTDGQELGIVPAIDNLATIDVHDILGRGTASLCWTSPSYKNHSATSLTYVDLMGGLKPGIMTKYSNGIGAEAAVTYVPSTKFYLEDERRGTPWLTRLSFPVQCVERITTQDMIAQTSTVTRYAYHNGHYDVFEREFRGFGMVEEWDSEDYSVADGLARFQQPPIYTKTWFHTGLPNYSEQVSQPLQLPTCIVPTCDNELKLKDAYRALKGSVIRQETYANDGSTRAALPYTAIERNYEVRSVVDGAVGLRIFRVVPRENMTWNFERLQAADARVTHSITLAIDDYGHVLKSASICYGRTSSPLTDPEIRPSRRRLSYCI
jgi:hypothetical protein